MFLSIKVLTILTIAVLLITYEIAVTEPIITPLQMNINKRKAVVLYDALPLVQSASVTIKDNESAGAFDCNTRIVECDSNSVCQSMCLPINNNQAYCSSNGICVYNTNDTPCVNGGSPIYSFSFSRNLISCICPEAFIGRFCQIPNLMRPIVKKIKINPISHMSNIYGAYPY